MNNEIDSEKGYWNSDIAKKISDAWTAFLVSEHGYLVRNGVREPSVTAAFWPFLQILCRDEMVVTVDHDQMFDGIAPTAKKEAFYEGKVRALFPDILFHRVGKIYPSDNLLVIEMKRLSNPLWKKDFRKLEELTSVPRPPRLFQYQYGLSLRFSPSGEFMAVLFIDGRGYSLDCPTFYLSSSATENVDV